MLLEEHPNWPPQWAGSYGPGSKFPIGDAGVLKEIGLVGPDRIGPSRIRIVIEYEGGRFSGHLFFYDLDFRERVHQKLNEYIGHPLHELSKVNVDS